MFNHRTSVIISFTQQQGSVYDDVLQSTNERRIRFRRSVKWGYTLIILILLFILWITSKGLMIKIFAITADCIQYFDFLFADVIFWISIFLKRNQS